MSPQHLVISKTFSTLVKYPAWLFEDETVALLG